MTILINCSWVTELGIPLAYLYALIVSVSDKDGLSCKTSEYFVGRRGGARVTIQRRLNILEDKGWISRKTITGNKRAIKILRGN